MPRRISLPSTVACKSRISNTGYYSSRIGFQEGIGNAEHTADGARSSRRYLAVTRHGDGLLRLPVDVKRMLSALAYKLAAVCFKVSDEITPLHAVRNSISSRSPAASPARRRFPSKTISIAS